MEDITQQMQEEERNHKHIKATLGDLIELGRKTFYLPEYQANIPQEEILGVIVAKFLEWTPDKILKTFSSALEDANCHELSAQIDDLAKSKTP
jgi:hypothetical protein